MRHVLGALNLLMTRATLIGVTFWGNVLRQGTLALN